MSSVYTRVESTSNRRIFTERDQIYFSEINQLCDNSVLVENVKIKILRSLYDYISCSVGIIIESHKFKTLQNVSFGFMRSFQCYMIKLREQRIFGSQKLQITDLKCEEFLFSSELKWEFVIVWTFSNELSNICQHSV